ncbi:MAG: DUF2341 domain-containing protein [Candidatus Brocadiia bacterium]
MYITENAYSWYIYKSPIAPSTLKAGWNLISFDTSNPSGTVGQPDLTSVTLIRIDIDTNNIADTFADNEIIIDHWFLTNVQPSLPTWVNGRFGKALSFDGTSNYVSMSSIQGIPSGNSTYAMEVWIKPNLMGTYGIVGWGTWGTTNATNALRLTASGLLNYWWGNDLSITANNLADGNWHHVVAQFDGLTRSIWVDGIQKGSDTPVGHNAVVSNFRIGSTNNKEYFPGFIDEVRIYNKALTASEILTRYNGGVPQIRHDYVDVRFTNQAMTQEYPYWQESDKKFWVKVPSIPNGTSVMMMCYGNPSAANISSGNNVFEYYDPVNNNSAWTKYSFNPVLNIGNGVGATQVYNPSIIRESDGTYKMWFRSYDANDRIGYATSADGVIWTKEYNTAILDKNTGAPWEQTHVLNPSVISDTGTYKMWYSGMNGAVWKIGYATSNDGIGWTRYVSNPVLLNGSGWESTNVGSPMVFKDGAEYKMWYMGNNGTTWKIGCVTSTDGTSWSRFSSNPVLDSGSGGTWDDTHVYEPFVIKDADGKYKMWYCGNEGTYVKLGYAYSDDGITWSKYGSNPVLDAGASGAWDDYHTYKCYVIREDGTYKMWYSGYDNPTWRIGYAYTRPRKSATPAPTVSSPGLQEPINQTTGLVVTVISDSRIDLSWQDNSPIETGFKIERSLNGIDWVQIDTTPANTTVYSDTTVTPTNTYYYRVMSYNAGVNNPYSNQEQTGTTVPSNPVGLITSTVSATSIGLQWIDNSVNEVGFQIERSLDGNNWTVTYTLTANASSYIDSSVNAFSQYYYRVRAYNGIGPGGYSNIISVAISLANPGNGSWQYNRAIGINNSLATTLLDYQVAITPFINASFINNTGLIGSWHFSEYSTTSTNDMSGNNNHLNIVGADSVDSRFGKALGLDGTVNKYGYVTHTAVFAATNPSIEAWIKLNRNDLDQTIVSDCIEGAWGDGRGYNFIAHGNGKLCFTVGNGSGSWKYVFGNTVLQPNTWYYVVGLYDGTNLKVYLNGIEDGSNNVGAMTINYTANGSAGPNPSTLYIGAQHNNTNSGATTAVDLAGLFDGVIDEVRIYNRVLTASEISLRYNSGNPIVRPDYADVRFLSEDLSTEYSYWQEADNRFWVKIPSLPSGNTTIWMLYGNPSATACSSISNTFIFADDFSSSPLSSAKWTGSSLYYAINSGIVKYWSDAVSWKSFSAAYTCGPSDEIIWESMYKTEANNNTHLHLEESTNRFCIQPYIAAGPQLQYRYSGTYQGNSPYVASTPADTWYIHKIIRESATSFRASTLDTNYTQLGTDAQARSDWISKTFRITVSEYSAVNSYFDWVRVRKYAATEPTTTISGTQYNLNGAGNLLASVISLSQVDLNWGDYSLYEDGFRIERSSNGVDWSEIATTTANTVAYSDTTVVQNNDYYYRVRSYYALAGNGPYSNISAIRVAVPDTPTALITTTVYTSSIALQWADNSGNEDTFQLERTINGITYVLLANLNRNTTFYTDSGLLTGTAYAYRIRAHNSLGDSVYSNTVSLITPVFTATGGIITYNGGYTIHKFNSSGTFTASCRENVEVLVVGGGGGGGETIGGGGGGGGLIYNTAFAVTPQVYPVTVGNGGAGGSGAGYPAGVKGDNSVFSTLTAIGGGAGAGYDVSATGAGGSAGGNGAGGGFRAAYTPGQGNDGGLQGDTNCGAGGGGAGAVGSNGASGVGGNGGTGLSYSISGSPVYYAGGGGGGTRNPPNGLSGAGGNGGGGMGAQDGAAGANGIANTGGGGGGGGYRDSGSIQGPGGAGGSGIVIIRYPSSDPQVNIVTNLLATIIAGDCIELSWQDHSPGENGFELCRSLDGANWTVTYTLDANTTIYTDTAVSVDTTYYYRVRSYNFLTNNPYSNVVVTRTSAPDAPSNLMTVTASSSSVTLQWDDNSNSETGFYLERSFDNVSWLSINTLSANITSCSDVNLYLGMMYYYRLMAYNNIGNSGYSNVKSNVMMGLSNTGTGTWQYCRPITITNSGSVLTDYQVIINPFTDESFINHSGLSGSWHFSEPLTDTVAVTIDMSGCDNNGILVNSPTRVAGKYGNGLQFNGSNSYVSIPHNPTLAPTSQITFEAWAYRADWSGYTTDSRILSKTEGGGYQIGVNETTIGAGNVGILVYRNSVYATAKVARSTLVAGWHYFVGTYDGRYTKFYVDGVLKETNDAGGTYSIGYTSSNSLIIGAEAGNGTTAVGQYFSGIIDEVRISNRALVLSEINARYNAGTNTGSNKVKNDYADVRFSDTGMFKELYYWQEGDNEFWVKIPSLPSGDTVINMFYGNSSAISSSDIANTMINDTETGFRAPVPKGALSNGNRTWSTGPNYSSVVLDKTFSNRYFEMVTYWAHDYRGCGMIYGPSVNHADWTGWSNDSSGPYWGALNTSGFSSGYSGTFFGQYHAPIAGGGAATTAYWFRQRRLDDTLTLQYSTISATGPWINFTTSYRQSITVTDKVAVGMGEASSNQVAPLNVQYLYYSQDASTAPTFVAIGSEATVNMTTNLYATAISANQINLTWLESSLGEQGFKLERSPDGSSWAEIAVLPINSNAYTDTSVSVDTTYYYRVCSYNYAGNNPYSNTEISRTSVPDAPVSLVTTTVTSSSIVLQWTDSSNNEDGFQLERTTNGTTYTLLATLARNINSYTDSGLIVGSAYAYRVRAYNLIGNSGYSNIIASLTLSSLQVDATGGTITNPVDGSGYRTHIFTSNGTFIINNAGVGSVDVYCWGGGGAGGTVGGWAYGSSGGAGGAARGNLAVTAGVTYQVVVGGGGTVNSYSGGAVGGGGAASNNNNDNRYSGGGGGYSGVFLSSVSQANAVIIAGGGGGGSSANTNYGSPLAAGGAGGGTSGQIGYTHPSYQANRGNPGTQTEAGPDPYNSSTTGAGGQGALQGGVPRNNSYGGGGGGGYWGGSGGGYNGVGDGMSGGGGGSGYVHPTLITGGILTTGSGTTPGDSANPLRSNAGNAGPAATHGRPGMVIIRYPASSGVAAVGGTFVDATNKIHTFTSSDTFNVTGGGNIEVLVVAGGGSGGNHNTTNANGGGGGGGVIYNERYAVTPGSYTVTVGAGGAAIPNATIGVGNNGQNSVFGPLIAIGGGGGGTRNSVNGLAGGSGGGAAWSGGTGGASTQTNGYGNAGGSSATSYTGAGGGGAGSAGCPAQSSTPGSGNGGRGFACFISGVLSYYAGGGGGGGNSSEPAGDGYDGGGRGEGQTTYYAYNNYPVETNATTKGSSTPNALTNSGGGGGGGSFWAANGGWPNGSGAGGSGIVIVRCPNEVFTENKTTNLLAYAIDPNQIDLTWQDNSPGENGFKVERSPDGSSWSEIATLPANSTAYSDTSVSPATIYYYRVRSYNFIQNNPYSNVEVTQASLPGAPTNLITTTVTTTSIVLQWNDNSNNEDGFQLERTSDGTTYTVIANFGRNITSCTDAGLLMATAYAYRVRAYNNIGVIYSNIVSQITPSFFPVSMTFNNTSTGQNGTIQTTTITQTGVYRIEAWGAQGGSSPTSYPANLGGKGARMRGDFTLAQGQALKILVGQQGTVSTNDGGGGGGSFVTDNSNNPFIVAGGGGGASGSNNAVAGVTTTNGASGPGGQAGGFNGGGGSTINSGAGGGLTGNGADGSAGSQGGRAFINGGTGGTTGSANCYGGFGGGGGSHGGGWGGGGGGGYSGGGGAQWPNAGGGGGSYNIGTNQSNSGGARSGQGLITIQGISFESENLNTTTNLFTKVVSETVIELTWQDNSPGENGFKVERSPDGSSWAQIADLPANTTVYTDTSVSAANTYYYRARSYNFLVNHPYSNQDSNRTVAVLAPSGLITTTTTAVSISLQWTDNANSETGYEVWRSMDGVTYNLIATLGRNVITYTDSGLLKAATYVYKVRAYNGIGNSDYSNVLCEATSAVNATGGTITYVGNIYKRHIFNSSGTFTVTSGSGNVEVLVVAGGGGGGKGEPNPSGDGGGGGGAGGLIYNQSYAVAVGSYTVTVGGGGSGSTANANKGVNGSDSVFGTLTAFGGGGGGSDNDDAAGANRGADGGSGGGAANRYNASTSAGSGQPGQGNAGGDALSNSTSWRGGSGGGGAGSAGATRSSTVGGAGGSGFLSSISGSPVFYAGGGGGGTCDSSGGPGGSGGGGNGGGVNTAGTAATANTGSGGGGGGAGTGGAGNGGTGGSGIVIVRYIPSSGIVATGGTIIEADFVMKKVHTFTSSGTFNVTSGGDIEVLVVGGGGSGGNYTTTNANGGGGGGGVIYRASYLITPTSYTVTVGNGGAAIANSTNSKGNNGQSSVFGLLIALGGGGGGGSGAAPGGPGQNGGSGGGAANPNGGGGAGGASIQTGGYGNAGGASAVAWTGGGGGGAGSAGVIGSSGAPGGNGGAGFGCSVSGTLQYYGGGGGGGGNSTERAGDGYDGGGRGFGNTSYYSNTLYPPVINTATRGSATLNAVPNTGGGGGGGSYWATNGGWTTGSGAGGSGIVIISYIDSGDNVPTNLVAKVNSATEIVLTWQDNSPNENGFKVERSADGLSWSELAGSLPANTAVYTDTGASAGAIYYYRVRSYNLLINHPYSNQDIAQTVAPLAPSGLITTTATAVSIGLQWADNANSEAGYEVWRSTDESSYSLIATLARNTTSYTDSGLLLAATYAYKVRAYNNIGNSNYSNVIIESTGIVKATGGTITYSGGYKIHTFTSSGTFNVTGGGNVEVLVVAGGGSGGNHSTTNANGGGGGGGVIYNTSYPVISGSAYTVTVGAGGASVPNSTAAIGNNGQNSVFGSLTAIGGGGGGAMCYVNGLPGGSGGGAAYGGVAGASTQTGGYGNAGGNSAIQWTGAGGGGAGGVGVAGNGAAPGGNGGAGFGCSISGTLKYYGGGGGGSGNSSERAGDGYDGGGRGEGATSYYGYTTYTPAEVNATTRGSSTPNGVPNTGGGGGGGSYWANNGGWLLGSGAGGSGIVIVRYLDSSDNGTTNLSAKVNSSSEIALTWQDNSPNESGFKVESSDDNGVTWNQIVTLTANATAYTDTGLTAGQAYYYRVRSYNPLINHNYSNTESSRTDLPDATSNLITTTVSSSAISLQWSDNDNETGYEVWRTSNGLTYSLIATLGKNVVTYTDSGILKATAYAYKVRAYNGAGIGNYSNVINSITLDMTATGGAITYSNGYAIHTFTSSGTFNVAGGGNVDVLVVGGGGSGGNHNTTNANGGGGGGGVISRTGFSVSAGVTTVTVGAGGAAIPNSTMGVGNNGQNSAFGSLIALGGGGGASTGSTTPAGSGGSGGGVAWGNSILGNSTQTDGYGNAGGNATVQWTGAGGGGAGGAGVAGSGSAPGGNGGAGIASSISGTLRYYGGGGGGSGNSTERAGDGFDGGGRGCGITFYYMNTAYPVEINPETRGSGTPTAVPNTGGGGGGGSYWASNGGWTTGSGAGGSGIVIVRYLISGTNTTTNLVAKVNSGTEVVLTWQDNSPGENGFKVERSPDGSAWAQIADLPANTTVYTDTGVSAATAYYYRVQSYNFLVNHSYSNVEPTRTSLPNAVSGLITTTVYSSSISLQWADNDNETGFEIWRSTDGISYNLIVTLGHNVISYTDNSAHSATSYVYKVRAYNGIGNSDYSDLVYETAFAMYATGGTITYASGYKIHTYTSAGTFLPTSIGNVEVYIWGGGGSGGTVGGWLYGAPGGAGGAAQGMLSAISGATYNIVVGGGGVVNSPVGAGAAGGGGEASNNNSSNVYAGGGGGYSGVFKSSVSQANACIIAGGGGGGGSSRAGTGNAGGAGGGESGEHGFSPYDGKAAYGGNPGTQSSFGANASSDSPNGGGGQGALQGGVTRTNSYGGGGGGGYWGGSAGGYSESNTMAGGGGGSGYISSTVISSGVLTAGSGTTPGDSSNPLRGTAGNAGAVAGNGAAGIVIIRYWNGDNITTNLVAQVNSVPEVVLTWEEDSPNESGFELVRSEDGTNWTVTYTLSANTTIYTDTAVSGGQTYYYRVRSYDSFFKHPYSNQVIAQTSIPLAPSNLITTTVTPYYILLGWTDNSSGEQGLQLERSLDGSSWTTTYTLSANTTVYTDTGLTPSTPYWYRVRAYNGLGFSDYSNTKNETTFPTINVTFNPTGTGKNGSIQTWTVPYSGVFTIEVWGAQGGSNTKGQTGGLGARMKGDFNLTAGQTIKILVGQQGIGNYYEAGGGGGTFVTDNSNNPLIIAGGGGGASNSTNGVNAVTTSSGTLGSGSGAGTPGSGGGGGSGSYGGCGGGLTGNGANGTWSNAPQGGFSFINGGTGGNGITAPIVGGYGGGAGAHGNSYVAGGGGGGYSGGTGGRQSGYGGGGGGSYNAGTNQSNSAGVRTGSGLVIITN